MRLVIAQRRLASLGGSETFVLTIAEHVAKLGHEVIIWASEIGLASKLAQERLIDVVAEEQALPAEVDATIALERGMAVALASRYPKAARLYVMHNTQEAWLPPPEPGIVAATIAANDRHQKSSRGCVGAGEVVRIRQPIDRLRFGVRGRVRNVPTRILLLSNYLAVPGHRINQLQLAWSRPGLEWHSVGGSKPSTAIAEEIAKADIVIGYGRSILEAMSCGRPAYVFEHAGSDGWVTSESYKWMEADGFAGTGARLPPDLKQFRKDFVRYDPEFGRIGNDLVRRHHDAGDVAAQVIAIIHRLGPPQHLHDPTALRALRYLSESQLRIELVSDHLRYECKRQAEVIDRLQAASRGTRLLRWLKNKFRTVATKARQSLNLI